MSYSITPTSTTVSEGVGSITFTITRTSTSLSETVYFSTLQNLGFTNNGDYGGHLNTPLFFGSGTSTRTITVNISNDSIIEGTESFSVLLDTASGTVLDTSTFTITDNDTVAPSTFSMTPASTTVSEGGGSITFTITRSSGAAAETVYFSTLQNQGATNNGDYTGILDRAVTFAAGVTSQQVTVNITNDSVVEGTETFGAVIENASGTVLDTSTFTITDNDTVAPSTFSMTPASTTVSEGGGSITFTITRSSGAAAETVYFSTLQNQGATNNGDYTGILDRAVTFAAGVTSQQVTVNITNDSVVEGTETFGAVIENASGTVLDTSTFTITDNDTVAPSTFTMTPASTTVSEGGGGITFTITRSSGAAAETVYFSTLQNQGATNNGDYTGILDRAVTFAAGVTSQQVTVNITNDTVAENTETFGVILDTASGTVLDTSTFTITDNDTVTPPTGTARTGGAVLTQAVTHLGEAWGRANCTGFVYTVAFEGGNFFFDTRASSTTQIDRFGSSTSTLLNNYGTNEYGFVVPIRDITNGGTARADEPTDNWTLVGSSGGSVTDPTFRDFQPGDLFRGRVVGNNGVEIMHSGVVSAYDPATNTLWLVDNFVPSGTSAPINYTNFVVNPSSTVRHVESQFAIYRLTPAISNPNDSITGGSSNDVLGGGRGNDTISGLGGSDTLLGGEGNDVLAGGTGRDILNGGAGTDYADYRLSGGITLALDGSMTATGDAFGDTLTSIEVIMGSRTARDVLVGNGSTNFLYGFGGNDDLNGRAGNDLLSGGVGTDNLTGGTGLDRFSYVARNEGGDIITDFSAADDTFVFHSSGFGNLPLGVLTATSFRSQATNAAVDSNDFFIFQTTNQTLWFDPDGNGAQGPIMIADLQAGATMTAADILLI